MGFFKNGNNGDGVPSVDLDVINSKLAKKEDKRHELLEKVCFYYGNPYRINYIDNVEGAAQEFAKYDIVVWGDLMQFPTTSGHTNAVLVAARMKELNPKIQLFGYVPIGCEPDAIEDSNLPMSEIERRIDAWKNNIGATGIFLDEFGYDYYVTRERQNACIQYCRENNLNVIVNAWDQTHVFSNDSLPLSWLDGFDGNPNRLAAIIGENDYCTFENMLYQYEDIDVNGVWSFQQRVAQHRRIKNMIDYTVTPRPAFGGKSWYEHYKTKGLGLDSIVNKDEQMFKEGYLLAVSCKLRAYSASTASWGSSSSARNYPFYEAPKFSISSVDEIETPVLESYKGVANAKVTTKVGDKIINAVFTNNSGDDFAYDELPPQNAIMSITIEGEEYTSGKTWKRPVNPKVGFQYYDIDLQEMFIYKGNDVWGQVASKESVIETRTDDPLGAEIGRIWIREDLV